MVRLFVAKMSRMGYLEVIQWEMVYSVVGLVNNIISYPPVEFHVTGIGIGIGIDMFFYPILAFHTQLIS